MSPVVFGSDRLVKKIKKTDWKTKSQKNVGLTLRDVLGSLIFCSFFASS